MRALPRVEILRGKVQRWPKSPFCIHLEKDVTCITYYLKTGKRSYVEIYLCRYLILDYHCIIDHQVRRMLRQARANASAARVCVGWVDGRAATGCAVRRNKIIFQTLICELSTMAAL